MEPFFIVSHIRHDGGAHSLTLYGYSSEREALRVFTELKAAKTIRYVQVVQRYQPPKNAPVEFVLINSAVNDGQV